MPQSIILYAIYTNVDFFLWKAAHEMLPFMVQNCFQFIKDGTFDSLLSDSDSDNVYSTKIDTDTISGLQKT